MTEMTFKEKIYQVTNQIPWGKVATYGQIAALAGYPRAARAVGMCMRTNPNAPATPCHRVVSSTGHLVGYSAGDGISTKKSMLRHEGVEFKGSKIDLRIFQWQPNQVVFQVVKAG